MLPTLVLTRPEAQSRALVAELGLEVAVVIAPVMEIGPADAPPDLGPYHGVILTSVNGVAHAPDLTGKRVYCVGKRTAEAARAKGGDVVLTTLDAERLVAQIKAEGPLVHLHGRYRSGNVAERLSSRGLETHSATIYDQAALPLADEARALIEGDRPVVLPLYSPRSAALVGAAVSHVGPNVHVIVISPAAAETWHRETGHSPEVCADPDGDTMRKRIRAACETESP